MLIFKKKAIHGPQSPGACRRHELPDFVLRNHADTSNHFLDLSRLPFSTRPRPYRKNVFLCVFVLCVPRPPFNFARLSQTLSTESTYATACLPYGIVCLHSVHVFKKKKKKASVHTERWLRLENGGHTFLVCLPAPARAVLYLSYKSYRSMHRVLRGGTTHPFFYTPAKGSSCSRTHWVEQSTISEESRDALGYQMLCNVLTRVSDPRGAGNSCQPVCILLSRTKHPRSRKLLQFVRLKPNKTFAMTGY